MWNRVADLVPSLHDAMRTDVRVVSVRAFVWVTLARLPKPLESESTFGGSFSRSGCSLLVSNLGSFFVRVIFLWIVACRILITDGGVAMVVCV